MDPNTPTPHLVRVRIGLTQEDATRLASALTAAGYPAEVEYLDGSGDYTVRVVNTHAAHGATWAQGYMAGNKGHEELLAAVTKIARNPTGTYSRDKEEYLRNVIAWCQETAQAAIDNPDAASGR